MEPRCDLPGATGIFYLYTIRSPQRDAIQAGLVEAGIESRVFSPHLVHRQPALPPYEKGPEPPHTPHAEAACRALPSIPLYPEMPTVDVRQVAAAIMGLASR